jgi:hypothetical protein
MIAQIMIECQTKTLDVCCENCFFKKVCLLCLKLSRDIENNKEELENLQLLNNVLCLEVGS